MARYHAGNTDTGSFNRQNLVNMFVCKTALKFFTDFIKQLNVHLMI